MLSQRTVLRAQAAPAPRAYSIPRGCLIAGVATVSALLGEGHVQAQSATRLQAELFTGAAQWQIASDTTTTYRVVPNGTGHLRWDDANAAPRISSVVSLPAGQYQFRARFSAPSQDDNSLWFRVNGGAWLNQYLITTAGSGWSEDDLDLGTVAHTGGNLTVDVAVREDGGKLDWVDAILVGAPPSPGTLSLGATQLTVREDAGKASVDVVRSGGSLGAASVTYQLLDDTATAGSDYTGNTGTVDFADGQIRGVIEVPIINDTVVEPAEKFGLALNSASGAGLTEPRTAQITITDNDSAAEPDSLVRQAENFLRVAPWQTGVSSTTTFAHVPNGAGTENYSSATSAPKITDSFTAAAGAYTVRARVRAPNGSDNSFYFRVNGGAWITIDLSTAGGSNFGVQNLSAVGTINHAGGTVTLEVAQREAGTAIDYIELVSTNATPTLPSFGVGKVELEATSLQNLSPAGVSFASNGTIVQVGDAASIGNARFRFTGATGTYNLELAYFDENDGAGTISVYVNTTKVLSFVANETNGGSGTEQISYRSKFQNGVQIPNGAEVRVEIGEQGGEYGRADFLRIGTTVPDTGTFSLQTVVTGLTEPTAIDFAPGGLIFVAQKNGVVRVIRNNALLPTPFVDLSAEVNGPRDRGLLGIAVHPQFPTQPYIYLSYTYDPPEVANYAAGTLAGPDGKGNRPARVVRLTADSATQHVTAVANSLTVILGKNSTWANISRPDGNSTDSLSIPPSGQGVNDYIPSDSESHTIGGLEFAPDGSLFVAIGDGTSYGFTDSRTARVQSLDSLSGKVVRINPNTGQGLTTNPFYNGDPGADRSKVYVLGLRNPFRLAMHPTNGKLYIGDVGYTKWEELNVAAGGENFGWPWYEGAFVNNVPQLQKTGGYQNLAAATTFYASAANATVKPPTWAISHTDGGRAIVCGDFYTGLYYPARFQNALFFNDYGVNALQAMFLKADGSFDRRETLIANSGSVMVEMSMGPDGWIYVVDITGRVQRLVYQ